MVGVTVLVEGTTIGTVTDTDGNFSLLVPEDAEILVFSFVGMITQRVEIGAQRHFDIILTEDAIGLEEVVAIGYGMQRRENLTGAVSTLDSRSFENRPITNIGQGLQGMAPNLNITQTSGELGAGASFNIRGYTSLSGGGPLVLIDGIPMDVNMINPNDVESVTVLKDAAASAIYGARATYGVILITTKSGERRDIPRISITSNYAMNRPIVFMELMNSMEQMTFMNEGEMRASGTNYFDDYKIAAITAHFNDPVNNPETFDHPLRAPNTYSYSANTDWPAELMKTQYPMLQNSASISGGTEYFEYYTSINHLYQEGITKHFDETFNRYNFMGKLNYQVTEWLNVGTIVSINTSDKHFPTRYSESLNVINYHSWPWFPVYNPDGTYASRSIVNVKQLHEEGGSRTRDIADNWLTGTARITPVDGVSFNIDYSYRDYNQVYVDHSRGLPLHNKDGFFQYATGSYPDFVSRSTNKINHYAFNTYADYENTFAQMHYFKAMIGYNQESHHRSNFSARRNNLVIPTIPYYSLATGERSGSDGASEYAIRGLFSRINYIYDQRYFLEFNGRYDGSSKFPKDDRSELFPSLAIGWRIDNEAFFGGLKNTMNMLKIRASYGSLGNQNVPGYYPYIQSFNSSQVNYLIDDDRPMTVYAPGLVSPTLTWETVVQSNVGLDISLLDNRLGANFDVYRRDTKGMLTASEPLPSILAVSEPRANAADLKTTGWDMEVKWRQQSQNVNWGLTLILADNVTEITKFENPRGLYTSHYEGKIMGEIWGLTTLGYFKTDEEAEAADQTQITGGRTIQAGDFKFADLDGDGKITRGERTLDNPGDESIIGNSRPRYSFGIRPHASWRNWNLDVLLQGVGKRDQRLHNHYYLSHYSSQWYSGPKIAADWWTPDNTDARFPRPWLEGCPDVTAQQTHWLQNAAYMRLKQLNIGYTVPMDLTLRANIERLYVFLSGQNLWEVSGMIDEISDPEQSGSRIYPLTRSLAIGINIDF